MKNKKYKWLLFDADGTLFDYENGEKNSLEKAFQDAGIEYDETVLDEYRKINGAIWLDREKGKIDPDVLKVKRFELLFESLDVQFDPARFSKIYLDRLGSEAELLENALETVIALAKDHKLVVVTNGLREVQRRRLRKTSLSRYFEEIIVSDEIGASKPDPEFFEITFEKIGNPRREDVMIIGDSLTSDIQGANNYGFDACWYNPLKSEADPDLDIKYEINDLFELVPILRAA